MRRATLLGLGLVFLSAASGEASVFTLESVNVNVRSTDPGLVLWSTPTPSSGWNFALDQGESHTTALFNVGTNETATNLDDLKTYPVYVALSFSAPAANGSTTGASGALGLGYVYWNSPAYLQFGTDGLLQVTLSTAIFGLPGKDTVYGKFQLIREASGVPVPEPSSMALVGIALAGVAARARASRRRRV
jgi:hypothetical protein